MVKAIFFDVGGVLCRQVGPSGRASAARILRVAPHKLEPYFSKLDKVSRGQQSEKAFCELIAKVHNTSARDKKALLGIFAKRNFVIKPRVLGVARKLRRANYIVGILSDTIPTHAKKHKIAGHYNLFHPVILSCEVGAKKPEAKIFQIARRRAGIKFSEIVFFDDKKAHVDAAKKLGIHAFIYRNPSHLTRSLRRYGVRM